MAILDFVFEEDKNIPEKYRYDVKLTDIDTNRVFYDKLTFIYLEMPKFSKSLEELTTRFDKWLYVIRNLNRLEKIPDTLREQVFEQLFDTAEIARFTPEQVRSYEKSLKYYRDLKNSLDTAFEDGRRQEKLEIAKEILSEQELIDKVVRFTGLDLTTVEELKHDLRS